MNCLSLFLLQQRLSFTVLKQISFYLVKSCILGCNSTYRSRYWNVAVYLRSTTGNFSPLQQHLPFTVLKLDIVAFVLFPVFGCNSAYRLRYWNFLLDYIMNWDERELQQRLPFTVLKLCMSLDYVGTSSTCCNSTYRLRYWNIFVVFNSWSVALCCVLPFTVRTSLTWTKRM